MNTSLKIMRKMPISVIILCCMFLIACGGGGDDGGGGGDVDAVEATGSITFRFQLQGAQVSTSRQGQEENIDCATENISTIEAIVYPEGGYPTQSEGPWECTADPITITGIGEGNNIIVAITAKDESGKKIYRGEATGITVNANQTTDVGDIVLLDLFVSSTIDSDGDIGYSSISLDSNDKVHITYGENTYDPNSEKYSNALKYATNISGSWEIFIIDIEIHNYYTSFTPSISTDSNDNVHIAYNDMYATDNSGLWETFKLDELADGWGLGLYSIATDSNDKVHISGISYNSDLQYITNVSGTWDAFTIDDQQALNYASIAIDSNDRVYISYWAGYYDENNEDLKYATNESGTWETFMIDRDDSGKLGEFPSIAVDSNDKVHISYSHGNKRDLKYATNVSGSWQTYIVDSQDYGALGMIMFSSIAIDSSDKVHISYQGYSRLKYANNVSGNWGITTVTLTPAEGGKEGDGGNGVFGFRSSIAIDSNGKVHICYDYNNERDLYYAYTE